MYPSLTVLLPARGFGTHRTRGLGRVLSSIPHGYTGASAGNRAGAMPENLTRQIMAEHLAEGDLRPGRPIALRIDQTLLQDATGTMSLMQFEQLDVPRVKVDR